MLLGKILRGGANCLVRHAISVFQRPLSRLMAVVLRNGRFSEGIHYWLLTRYPALHGQLRDVAARHRVVEAVTSSGDDLQERLGPMNLPPHAQRIYAELQAAINKRREVT